MLHRFARSERGVVFVEFAFIAPFLIALLIGGFELTRYINTMRKLTYLSNSVAQILTQTPADTGSSSGSITDDTLNFARNATVVVFPDVLADAKGKNLAWAADIKVTMSSIALTPTVTGCTSGCTYKATTTWTTKDDPRPCATSLLAVADTAAPSPTTLPTDVFGPGSLIVVDVVYTYTPLVAETIFKPMTVRRSAYLQPRYVDTVKYTPSDSSIGVACP